MSRQTPPDALIVGAGHNGLVCAFYLAKAGWTVRMVEARDVVGGAAVTEEFHPGYRNSTASYTVSLLQPKVIADMDLHCHGLTIVERPLNNFLPTTGGDALVLGGTLEQSQAEIARFSKKDAAALPAYYAALDRVADQLRALALKPPPEVGGGLGTLVRAWRQGRPIAALGIDAQRDMLALFTKSAREFLDSWFESEPVKALFGFDAVVGNYASPDTPGSAYVLLHHVFGEVNGKKGVWGHAIGGMGAITQAMARACKEQGVVIETGRPVEEVLVTRGRTAGVRLKSGETIDASTVIANVGPKLLFQNMIDPSHLPASFAQAIDGYAVGSGTVRMNVALDRLPSFPARPGSGPHLSSGIVIAPSLDYMDRAYSDARETGMAREPIVEMLIPSTLDDSLAPAGHHVASLFCQQFAPVLPDGQSWDDRRDEAADLIVATVEKHAPGFADSIVAQQVHTPLDLERKFGLSGGDIFHGRMSIDQLWSARPVLGHGSYSAPIPGLFLCGSGTHPGGGVTGAPGHNAAREILRRSGWKARLGLG